MLRCQSLNVTGLNKSIIRSSIFSSHSYHFSFLQETYILTTWEAEWGGKALFSNDSTNSTGVIILINPKLDCKIEKVIADKDGRYVIEDICLNQIRIVLVNIYAPNYQTQQVLFFKRLQQHIVLGRSSCMNRFTRRRTLMPKNARNLLSLNQTT